MSLSIESTAILNNGVKIPRIGLGVYQILPGKSTVRAVKYALEVGYKHIDTAKIYGNEVDVGNALKENDSKREDIFITTKVWNTDQGYDSTLKACDSSLKRLGLTYVDLYLIHWPVAGKIKGTWKAMTKLLEDGKVNSIGVSNYSINELQETIQDSNVVPAVNQVEFHPFNYSRDLLKFCADNKIQVEAYSPLTRGKKLNDDKVLRISKKYNKSPAQILIRWNLQHDLVVIPKSSHEDRILENSNVYDFRISQEDMDILNKLNENLRTVFLD